MCFFLPIIVLLVAQRNRRSELSVDAHLIVRSLVTGRNHSILVMLLASLPRFCFDVAILTVIRTSLETPDNIEPYYQFVSFLAAPLTARLLPEFIDIVTMTFDRQYIPIQEFDNTFESYHFIDRDVLFQQICNDAFRYFSLFGAITVIWPFYKYDESAKSPNVLRKNLCVALFISAIFSIILNISVLPQLNSVLISILLVNFPMIFLCLILTSMIKKSLGPCSSPSDCKRRQLLCSMFSYLFVALATNGYYQVRVFSPNFFAENHIIFSPLICDFITSVALLISFFLTPEYLKEIRIFRYYVNRFCAHVDAPMAEHRKKSAKKQKDEKKISLTNNLELGVASPVYAD
ncbi:unnamed protein product [Caenorhabditis bovis]|uniref:Uncharacterized protein n=1 Tax=Caenorhabditis bovis TaxID=2654633 RepID=A0A8S1EAL8_9PELO|nr:unnamed protein product [Caenorhabditis bovis]